MRGTKTTTWEGGIRIPYMIQWKGHVPAGKVDDRPVIALDIHPTALAAAGVTAQPEKKLDGVNLLPFLQGTSTNSPHEFLFWRFGNQMAVRKGDWKLTQAAPRPPAGTSGVAQEEAEARPLIRRRKRAERGAVPQLYNLAQDIGESKDLSADHPDTVKELMDAWQKWDSELMAPRWGRANPQARRPARQPN